MAINTSVVTGCLLCGIILNKNNVSSGEDIVKIGILVTGNITANVYLLKKHLKI